jgi:hypothetical protein
MKRFLLWSWLIAVIAFGCKTSSESVPANPLTKNEASPKTKYRIDGSFADWTNYTACALDVGLDLDKDVDFVNEFPDLPCDSTNWPRGFKVVTDAPRDDKFEIKGIYCANDDAYLYLFLKLKPGVIEWFKKERNHAYLGMLYIASSCDVNTGAGRNDASRTSETRINVSVNRLTCDIDGKVWSVCDLECSIDRWNSSAKDWAPVVNRESDRCGERSPFLAHGPDGVEIAIPFSDIQKTKGDSFCLICDDEFGSGRYATKIPIKLK